MKRDKPWGYEEVLSRSPEYVVKRIVVNPNHRLSLQYHKKKSETMFLVKGKAKLYRGSGRDYGTLETMSKHIPYHIQPLMIHRLECDGDERCIIIEISTPELDDVVRVEDDYNRG